MKAQAAPGEGQVGHQEMEKVVERGDCCPGSSLEVSQEHSELWAGDLILEGFSKD